MKIKHLKQSQRGVSLIFALIALVGLGLAGVSTMRATDATTLVAGNLGFRETAAKATDLGLEAGIAGLTAMTATQRLTDLAASNYFASLESVNLAPTTARLSSTLPTGNVMSDTATSNAVRYVIERMCQNTGPVIPASANPCVMDAAGTGAQYRVTAMTLGPHNASQTTQVMAALDVPAPMCAMMFQGHFRVSGELRQNGSSTCLHSNTSVNISGNAMTPGIEAGAVGSAVHGGSGTVILKPNDPARNLLPVNPTDHRPYATHIFSATGVRTNIAGTTAATAGDWVWEPGASPPQWKLNVDKDGTCPPAGRYYFESNVEIPKKIGSSTLTCNLSIITTGCLKINGLVFLQNYRGTVPTGVPAATNNVFLMAGGGDLELPGSSRFYDGTVKTAVISAKSDLKANGELNMEAALTARNEPADPGACNLVDENIIPGNVTQTYNGGGAAGGPMTATRKSWRFATR